MSQSYDIIGDIHGRYKELKALFKELGYERVDGVYKHPKGRKVVFLGDFCDKGPEQKKVIDTVRSMVEAGEAHAVMGNHEFNAICFATERQDGEGYVRPHTEKNQKQNQRFIDEYPFGSDEYYDTIEWFKTLPLYLDLEEFRVVHACWDDEAIKFLDKFLTDSRLTDDVVQAYGREAEPLFTLIESVTKGPNYKLPDGLSFKDPMGHERDEGRVFWWSSPELPVSDMIGIIGHDMDEKMAELIKKAGTLRLDFMKSAKPTFIGHYYLPGEPRHLSDYVTGLDYRGAVTAYRWNGPSSHGQEKFVQVEAHPYP